MQDLCILVGLIHVGVGVVTIIYVGAVDIAVAVCDCICIYRLGHDALFKMTALWRNNREMCRVNERVYKTFPWAKLKRSGVI